MFDNADAGFYIVLPSNVPTIKGTGRSNTTSNYKTLLPRAIDVHDRREFEVALVEICYPQSWQSGIMLDECSYIYRSMHYNRNVHHAWLDLLPNHPHLRINDQILVKYLRDSRKRYTCTPESARVQSRASSVDELVNHLNLIRPEGMRGKFYRTEDNRIGVELDKFESIEFTPGPLSDLIRFRGGIATYRAGLKRRPVEGEDDSRTKRSADAVQPTATPATDASGVPETDDGEVEYEEPLFDLIDQEHHRTYLAKTEMSVEERRASIEKIIELIRGYYVSEDKRQKRNYYGVETDKAVILGPRVSNLFIYSDLCAETFVGHEFVPLLRTVAVKTENKNKYVTESFAELRYLTLARSRLKLESQTSMEKIFVLNGVK